MYKRIYDIFFNTIFRANIQTNIRHFLQYNISRKYNNEYTTFSSIQYFAQIYKLTYYIFFTHWLTLKTKALGSVETSSTTSLKDTVCHTRRHDSAKLSVQLTITLDAHKAVNTAMTVFTGPTLCSLVNRHKASVYIYPEDGGSKSLRNVGRFYRHSK